jgi:protein gp37
MGAKTYGQIIKAAQRIDCLRNVPAKVKFISFESLLDDVGKIDLSNIDWAIVGGESGHHARHIDERWVLNIKKQCEKQKVLFYFKQWGGTNKKKAGRLLLGRTWDEIPSFQ